MSPRNAHLTLVRDEQLLGAISSLETTVAMGLLELRNQSKRQFEQLKGWGSTLNPYYVVVEDPLPIP